jgi:hypothetical protein
MALVSRNIPTCNQVNLEKDWQLFCRHLDLLLESEQIIFNSADYFFCCPSFASCSWPYLGGSGDLYIGYLLLGKKTRQLIEHCPYCTGGILITSFAGSPLSGGNKWTGLCLSCRQTSRGEQSSKFKQYMEFVLALRQRFPAAVQVEEEYDDFKFTWGGSGLEPVIKKKVVQMPVANPVTLAVLIRELKTGNIRQGKPVNVHLLKRDLKLKFCSNRLNSIQL